MEVDKAQKRKRDKPQKRKNDKEKLSKEETVRKKKIKASNPLETPLIEVS
jgi:hypothetical protein